MARSYDAESSALVHFAGHLQMPLVGPTSPDCAGRRKTAQTMVNMSWLPPYCRAGVRAAGRQSQRACRRRHGLARGDRAQPLGQDRLHHQPDPQSAQRAAQSRTGCRCSTWSASAACWRANLEARQGAPAAAISLSQQHREDGRQLPDWPERTADISEIGIEVRFAPANAVGRLLSEITGSPRA